MADQQLDLIRRYCDMKGIHLSGADKELLCSVLESPEQYDGYVSQVYTETNAGKDFEGRWEASTSHQYRINIGSELSIDSRYKHECDDGYLNDKQWNNPRHITDAKEIIRTLREINGHDAAFMTPKVVKDNGVFDVVAEKSEELCQESEVDGSWVPSETPSYDGESNDSVCDNGSQKAFAFLGGIVVVAAIAWLTAPKIKDGWNNKVKPWLKEKRDKLTGRMEQSPDEEDSMASDA